MICFKKDRRKLLILNKNSLELNKHIKKINTVYFIEKIYFIYL